jgi:hypothetical protein
MPYRIVKSGKGAKVVSPNHPGGFSKHPQSEEMAKKQLAAIKINTKEESEKPAHEEWANKIKGRNKKHSRSGD